MSESSDEAEAKIDGSREEPRLPANVLDYATSYRRSESLQRRRLESAPRPPQAPAAESEHHDRVVRSLVRENHELKLRVAALLDLLLARGVISAEEAAALLRLPEQPAEGEPSFGIPTVPTIRSARSSASAGGSAG